MYDWFPFIYLLLLLTIGGICLYFFNKITQKHINKESGLFAQENGIRIKYDNEQLSRCLCIPFDKEDAYLMQHDKEKFSEIMENKVKTKIINAGKERWMELSKELGLNVEEFTDEDMLISWDSVECWTTTFRRSDPVLNRVYSVVEVKFNNMPSTLDLSINANKYFKKAIPEKRTLKVNNIGRDIAIKTLYVLFALFGIYMIFRAISTFKNM